MGRKFALGFKSQNWSLRFKALLFGGALWWAWAAHFAAIPTIIFWAVSLIFYFYPTFQNSRLLFSFFLLLSVVFGTAHATLNSTLFAVIAVLGTSLVYALLLIKEYHVIDRQRWYRAMHFAITTWGAAFLFFAFHATPYVAFVYFLLMYESLLYARGEQEEQYKYETIIFSAVCAFLLYQATWALELMPIGFISQAGILILLYYVIREAICEYFQKTLSRTIVLRLVTITMCFTALILLSSRWASIIGEQPL